MSYRLYRSPTIGSGKSPKDAIRPKIDNYIINDGTMDYDSFTDRNAAFQYCLVNCSNAIHNQIVADAEMTVLSPTFNTIAAFDTWMNGLVGTLTTSLQTTLEADGCIVRSSDSRKTLWAQKATQSVTIMGATIAHG